MQTLQEGDLDAHFTHYHLKTLKHIKSPSKKVIGKNHENFLNSTATSSMRSCATFNLTWTSRHIHNCIPNSSEHLHKSSIFLNVRSFFLSRSQNDETRNVCQLLHDLLETIH